MEMTRRSLSYRDVERLLADRSAGAQIETLQNVISELQSEGLSYEARRMAEGVVQAYSRTAEQSVREALAWQIAHSSILDRDLAERLSRDVASVAFPVLRYSQELDDALLLEVIAEGDGRKQVAVAMRDEVSARVSDALVDQGSEDAVVALMGNSGATIPDPAYDRALDRFESAPAVAHAVAGRNELPAHIAEKLVHRVAEEMRRTLVARYNLSPVLLRGFVDHARESVTALMLQPVAGRQGDLDVFVEHLLVNNRLSPSLMLRALCAGDVGFFIVALAKLCRIAPDNARCLALQGGALGLRAAFEKAGIPTALMPPFSSAIEVVNELGDTEGDDSHRHAFQVRALSRVFGANSANEDPAVDELLRQLFDGKPEPVVQQAMDDAGIPFAPVFARG
ncbi:DUF2336 domain-containing protein [Algihabitans albus]|uniref:DUF2336 domain-containing protein n=1 Tax=Algihabitans albus TaxID=2164067 RepID=UPI000E5D0D00|nr:DUF2336 domain-containing protein [Algihabitans albus]